jgi:hypothetical protein
MRNRLHVAADKRLLPSSRRALEHMNASSISRRSGRPEFCHAASMLQRAGSDLKPLQPLQPSLALGEAHSAIAFEMGGVSSEKAS